MKDPLSIHNNPRLYAIAKQITLDAGFPYTDPRTLETTQPGENKMKTKIPKWILLDQWHVDLEIVSNMSPAERTKLKKDINNFLRSFLYTGQKKTYRIKVTQ